MQLIIYSNIFKGRLLKKIINDHHDCQHITGSEQLASSWRHYDWSILVLSTTLFQLPRLYSVQFLSLG
jgi:hypothetical protein